MLSGDGGGKSRKFKERVPRSAPKAAGLTALQALRTANAADPTAAVMAPRTEATYNKLKDSTAQPLRRPVILGNFAELMIGMRTQIRIDLLKETFAANGQYAFLAWMRSDVQLMRAASFAQITGII